MPGIQVVARKSLRTYAVGPLWSILLVLLSAVTAALLAIPAGVVVERGLLGSWWAWIPSGVGLFLLWRLVRARGTKRFAPWSPGPRPVPADAATEARVAAAFRRRGPA